MHSFKLQPKHFALMAFTSLMLLLMVVAFIGSQNSKELRSKAAHPPEPRETQVPTKPPPPPPVSKPPPPPPTATLPPGPSPTNIPSTFIVRGFHFTDTNQDAIKGINELNIPEITMRLLRQGTPDTLIGTTLSTVGDAEKNYQFTGITAGLYTVDMLHDMIVVDANTKPQSYPPPSDSVLIDCSSVGFPVSVPADNRYFFCFDDTDMLALYKWTPNQPNPYIKMLNNYFNVGDKPIVNVDFPHKTLAPVCEFKKYGDANCDGSVDGIDYSVWLNSQCRPGPGQACADLKADFDNDGDVDDEDYQLWFDGRNTIDQLKKK